MKVAVIGATGFTGEKLIEILLKHPKAEISYISAVLDKELAFSELFPKFKNRLNLVCEKLDLAKASAAADIIFLALPHKVSFSIAPYFIKKKKTVIDLSADYRIKDTKVYEAFYKAKHLDLENLKKAAYGLPEFFRIDIKKAKLIANPGCYPTATILSLGPLLKEGFIKDVIVDAKSGITGAGRKASLDYHYAHVNGNSFCYKPFGHQHLPEMNQILSKISGKKVSLRFSPHVIPVERGILITAYATLIEAVSETKIKSVYKKYYKNEPFVRFFDKTLPQLKDVIESNFCDIGFKLEGKNIVIVGAIDNLIKGASGQAVQNMNILLGLDETMGLLDGEA